MNEFAQATVIAGVGDRTLEGTFDPAANRADAETAGIIDGIGRQHTVTAYRTDFAADGLNLFQAIRTYWQPRNIQQRGRAQAAVGGEQNREDALGGALNPKVTDADGRGRRLARNNTRPNYCRTALASPDSVLATAEDGLLVTPVTTLDADLVRPPPV